MTGFEPFLAQSDDHLMSKRVFSIENDGVSI